MSAAASPTPSGPSSAAPALSPIDLTGFDPALVRRWLTDMSLIRAFETAAEPLVVQGKIPGGMHSAIGQEATAVGTMTALGPDDIVTGTHRSHHITLAKGLDPSAVMAELFGRATGLLGGRGGHMHLADMSLGHFGSNGIVGAGLGIALGAALASSVRRSGQVAVGFMGDGAANIGRVWEFVNLAQVWSLPLVVVCENNLYAVETPYQQVTGGGDIARRASGFGITADKVDGQDVAAVYRVVRAAADRARAGAGPSFVESLTYRHGGHDVGDRETYRTRDEVAQWRAERDPLDRLAAAAVSAGVATAAEVSDIRDRTAEIVAAAITFADASPEPDAATVTDRVTAIDTRIRRA